MKKIKKPRSRNIMMTFAILFIVITFLYSTLHVLTSLGGTPFSQWQEEDSERHTLALPQNNSMMAGVEDHDHTNLPTCQELMQQPFSPFADGSFLSRISNPVVWKMRRDGSRELTLPSTCRLKQYRNAVKDAQQCLKNKSLLFLGDSLTRYQYLSLAYFVEHKKFPPRFQALNPCNHQDENGNNTCSKRDEPNVCAEGDWNPFGGWHTYMQNIGGGTDGGVFNGRMESQSVRADQSIENYQYVSASFDGHDAHKYHHETSSDSGSGSNSAPRTGYTKLSFVSELGWVDQEFFSPGWNFTDCAHNASCRYTPEEYRQNQARYKAGDFDWNHPSIIDAFGPNGTSFQDQHRETNYVFYNRGVWGKIQKDKAKKVMKSLYNFTAAWETSNQTESNRCFFRSTTGCERTRDGEHATWEYNSVRKATYASGCEYFDVAHLTEEFSTMLFTHPKPSRNLQYERSTVFWDSVHYQPWVYEELNNMLLNVLCNGVQEEE